MVLTVPIQEAAAKLVDLVHDLLTDKLGGPVLAPPMALEPGDPIVPLLYQRA